MTAKIIAVTQPTLFEDGTPITSPGVQNWMTPEQFIAYTARVSNPGNQMNTLTAPKLLTYLIKHKHWSPFEMVHVCMEINTTRDIAHQIVRHRSFSFQEFSQRYADPTKDMGFTTSEARMQDLKNRQNSIELDGSIQDQDLQKMWVAKQQQIAFESQLAYNWAIDNGLAKEVARKILPEGLTNTRLYMSGSLRSWIHYVDVRATEGTQKEHREVALEARDEILNQFPSLNDYWYSAPDVMKESYYEDEKDMWPKKPWWKFW